LDGFGQGKEVLLLAEGIGDTEEDLLADGLLQDLVVQLGLDGIGGIVDLRLQRVLLIRLTGRHDIGKELLDIEDVFLTLLADVLGVHVGQFVGTLLHLRRHLLLRSELRLDELLVGTQIGQTLLVDSELECCGDVVLTGVGLRPGEDTLTGLGTLIHLKGLVLEFGAYPATEVAILLRLVLVEHTHDGAMVVGGQAHESFDGVLCHHAIVDIGHEVANTVKDDQVGLVAQHKELEDADTVGHGFATDVEHIHQLDRKLVLGDACEGDDTIAQDVLRRLLALLGVIPQHVQPFLLDPFDGEQLTAKAQGHEDATDKGLAALGLARQTGELAPRKAGAAAQAEQELHGWELGLGRDTPSDLQLAQALLLFAGDASQAQLLANQVHRISVPIHRL